MAKKSLLSILVVAIFCNTGYVSFATNLSPETQAIEENKVKFEQLDGKISSLNSEISKLNIDIEDINNKLIANNNEIEKTDSDIKLINSQIESTKADIEKKQDILDERIRSMYKSNMNTDMLLYVITSTDLLDAVNRVYAVSKIVSLDKVMINDVKEKNDFLVKSSDDLNKKQGDLNLLKESTLKDLNSLQEKQSEQQEGLAELNSEKAAVASIIGANEEKLISHPLSVVNSDSSTSNELQSAIDTLKSLIPQLSSDYVISIANNGISKGEAKMNTIVLAGNGGSNNNGSGNETYIATYTMEATAYTGGTITATGLRPVRNPNGISTIAVDPSVIPLGSKVLIPGYGYAIASDTGGAIKGHIIDLYLNSNEECISWGRRNVTLHLIALPGSW